MKLIAKLTLAGMLLPALAHAELPQPPQKPDEALIQADQAMITDTGHRALQQKLRNSVFTVTATPHTNHALVSERHFDGAAVAVTPETVREVLPADSFVETVAPAPENPKPHTSFFDRGLAESTSPFSKRQPPAKTITSEHQYYLTTADWLTGSDSVNIRVSGKDIPAKIAYRDEANNVAILESQPQPDIHPVPVYSPERAQPQFVYVLLSPGTIYETLTQHTLHAPDPHLYGTIPHLTARNGYPIFASTGELCALTVGPDTAHTKAFAAHPGVLDRALHPQKYDRTTLETITPKTDY